MFVHQHASYKVSDNSSSRLENHPLLATKDTSNIYTYIMVPDFSLHPWIPVGEYCHSVRLPGFLDRV